MKHTHLLWEIFWSDKALVPSEILFARALHNEAEQKPFFLKDLCQFWQIRAPNVISQF